MIVNYDTDKINNVLQSFYDATGINIQLRRNDFSAVGKNSKNSISYCKMIQNTEQGRLSCRASDMELMKKCKATKKSQMHICHAGLADVAVPILNEGEILGYIILGQMRVNNDFNEVSQKLLGIPVDYSKMESYYLNIPAFDEKKVAGIANIASILARYILTENMLKSKRLSFSESVEQYIQANIDKNLTVTDICENVGISKSALYANMHIYHGCTVSEYINQKRVDKACKLLENTDYSVEMIGQMAGFSGTSYFSRTFKKITGTSPVKYRKET